MAATAQRQFRAEPCALAPRTGTGPEPLPLERLFADQPVKRRRAPLRHVHHPMAFALNLVLFLGLMAAIAAILPWRAPAFVSSRTEAAIEAALPGVDVALGEAVLGLTEGRPVLTLRNAVLRDADGVNALHLDNLELVLNRKAALKRQLRPERLTISDMRLALSRDAQGRFNLAFGGDGAAVQAASIAGLVTATNGLMTREVVEALTEVSIESLRVAYDDARLDQSWRAYGAARLTRSGDVLRVSTQLDLPEQGPNSTIELGWETTRGDEAAVLSFRMTALKPDDLASQFPALAWLGALDAPISGALRAEARADDSIGPLSATLSIGQGALRPTAGSRPVPFEHASVYMTYAPSTRALTFDQIEIASAWGKARAHGQAFLEGGVRPEAITAQLTVENPILDLPETFAAPLEMDRIRLEFRTQFQPFRVELADAHAQVNDQLLRVSGEISASDAGWAAALDARASQARLDDVMALWPLAMASGARRWVERHIEQAVVSDMVGAFRLRPGEAEQRYATFRFADTVIRPFAAFPAIMGAGGTATFTGDRFTILAEQGHATAPNGQPVTMAGTAFVLSRLGMKPAHAWLELQAKGSIPDMMRLLDEPPFALLTPRGIAPDLAEGQAETRLTASWDVKPGNTAKDVDWQAEAVLREVRADQIVEGRRLSADRLRFAATPERLEIGGEGRLDGLRFDAVWRRAIGGNAGAQAARVAGRAWLDADAARAFNLALPEGTIGAGVAQADFTLDLPDGGAPRLSLQSRLEGLALAFAPLGVTKPRNAAGRLNVTATLGETLDLQRLQLQAGGLSLDGTLRAGEAGLQTARFPDLRVGNWLQSDVTLEGRGAGAPPAIALQGGRIDWRRFSGPQGGASGSGGTVPLRVRDALFILTDTINLQGLDADLQLGDALQGRFTGQYGPARVQGEAVAVNGETRWRMVTDNAGAALTTLGLLRQGRGGQAQLDLHPISESMYRGDVALRDLRVQQWPLLGGLLNTLSLVGIVDQLSGNGLVFSQGNARFRLTEGGMWLDQLALVGPAVGVSATGAMNFGNKRMQFEGVLSPAYAFNALGRAISPRDGEGAFGFRFNLRGTSDRPQVEVNPISILLPGGMRELLR